MLLSIVDYSQPVLSIALPSLSINGPSLSIIIPSSIFLFFPFLDTSPFGLTFLPFVVVTGPERADHDPLAMIITLPSLNCITLSFTGAAVAVAMVSIFGAIVAEVSVIVALSFDESLSLALLLQAITEPVIARSASNFFIIYFFYD